MSDGWGSKVSEGQAIRVGACIVRREGKYRAEFLLEKSIIKTIDAWHIVNTAISWTLPRNMGSGKSGWHVFQAQAERDPDIRRACPGSPIMTFSVQDGLHAAGMGAKMRARIQLQYDATEPDISSYSDHPLRLQDWFFFR
jgi:hypothetical protein